MLALKKLKKNLDECDQVGWQFHLASHFYPIEHYFIHSYQKIDLNKDFDKLAHIFVQKFKEHPVIRCGWLEKYSQFGFQPRFVILFSKFLIYASRIKENWGFFFKVKFFIVFFCILNKRLLIKF